MKRSQINTILADTEDFIHAQGFRLPGFAYLNPEEFSDWVANRDCEGIVKNGMGWTVTDFGLGSFQETGLVVFTVRMGSHAQLASGSGKLYAEKFLVQREGQRAPYHYHRVKTEDVVNRSEATMALRLYHATEEGELDESKILHVQCDGQAREFAPGESISLRNGESITIEPKVYHDFAAKNGDVLAVEISLANDDANDNFFYEPVGVAQDIEEDEEPRRLLVQDYAARFPGLAG